MNTFEKNTQNMDSFYVYGLANYTYGSDVIYKSEYDEKDNLLLIGDSYAAAVEPLLLEHFSTIYFIQPYDYYWKYGEKFNYDVFLANHDIDKILFMYTVENYFYANKEVDRAAFFDIYRERGE